MTATENIQTIISLESINSSKSKKYGLLSQQNILKNIKNRIDFDSIMLEETNTSGWNRNSLENKTNDTTNNLFEILNSIDGNCCFNLPNIEFYKECYDECLLSKIFRNKDDNDVMNVVYFFIFSKIILEKFSVKGIIRYLGREKRNIVIAKKIFKVFECTKRILISHRSRFSTLQIIKENVSAWNLNDSEENKILDYALLLIKSMLLNVNLTLITKLNFKLEKFYEFGLEEFKIDVFTINKKNNIVKVTINLSTFIISHIISMIEQIYDDCA
jgi:hypothetical protein